MVHWIVGFLFTSVLGYLGIGRLLKLIRHQIRLPHLSNSEETEDAWKALTKHPKESGDWVGIFERIILFWALYESSWEAVGIWMLFKVAAKWEARNHLAYIPEKIGDVPEIDWAAARRVWAAREYATFVVGTAANLLLAAAGVWIGRFGPETIQLVRSGTVPSHESLDERCGKLLDFEQKKDQLDDQQRRSIISSEYETFYSKKLTTCVVAQVNVLTPSFRIRDSTKNFLQDFPTIFQCDADMHFEANLEKVRELGGRVANVPYDNWGTTDDRSGSGKAKLSTQECQVRFEAMLQRLKE